MSRPSYDAVEIRFASLRDEIFVSYKSKSNPPDTSDKYFIACRGFLSRYVFHNICALTVKTDNAAYNFLIRI